MIKAINMHTLAKGGSHMINGNGLMPYVNICIEFSRQISLDKTKPIWAAEYIDYNKDKIIIIPESSSFIPQKSSKYLVQRPKGFEQEFAIYDGCHVYKRRILEIFLRKITQNNIFIYRSDYYVPKCALQNSNTSVFLRPSKSKNQFALIWIENDRLRSTVFDYIYQNVPHSVLLMNKSNTITIEGEQGKNINELEEDIIKSINNCLKG